MAKDYYEVLGVAQNSTEKQIRQRFLELARERHPDRFRGDDKQTAEAEFQEITEAYNVLIDRDRRRQLDSELSRPEATQGNSSEAARVYISCGMEALRAGQIAEAIENLEQATREDSTNGKGWYQLGVACQERPGGLGRARAARSRACELEPMNATYLKAAAEAFEGGGMYAEAAKLYKEALDWGGEDPQVRAAFEAALRQAKSAG